jgi:hypothetical protein
VGTYTLFQLEYKLHTFDNLQYFPPATHHTLLP